MLPSFSVDSMCKAWVHDTFYVLHISRNAVTFSFLRSSGPEVWSARVYRPYESNTPPHTPGMTINIYSCLLNVFIAAKLVDTGYYYGLSKSPERVKLSRLLLGVAPG